MEFKFRAVDDRPPSYLSPSSSIGFFTEQAFRDFPDFPDFSHQNPNDVHERIQREMEKERIREEIITAEIARRRMLEAEVRRELMMEREMAMRRAAEMGFSFEDRLAMRFDPRFPLFENRWLEDRFSFPGRGGAFDVLLPPLPQLPDAMGSEIKAPSEVNNNKDKLIMLAKPDPNMAGSKRKAVTPPAAGAGDLPVFGIKKKPKEEWSCALCQVSATSERGLNEHLQGRKHKSKEAGLRAQKMKASFGPLPKKTGKASKPMETNGTAGSDMETKVEEESFQQNKTGDDSGQKMEDTEDLNNKKDKPPAQKKRNSEYWKKKNEMARVERTPEFRNKKKFRFWCEMCQIGAYSETVMDTHKKGKKHRALLPELGQNGEAVPNPTTVASPEEATTVGALEEATTVAALEEASKEEISKEAKELDEMAEEEDEKPENVLADADESSQSPEAN